jgi:hypothetical protein
LSSLSRLGKGPTTAKSGRAEKWKMAGREGGKGEAGETEWSEHQAYQACHDGLNRRQDPLDRKPALIILTKSARRSLRADTFSVLRAKWNGIASSNRTNADNITHDCFRNSSSILWKSSMQCQPITATPVTFLHHFAVPGP